MKGDQLSQTAAFVAIKFYGLTQKDSFRSLFEPSTLDFYDRLVRQLPKPLNYYHFWLQHRWIRKLYTWSEELLLPGDLLHVVGRKWMIQNFVQKLVDDGYEQLIVLGAGFDHLGYHYAQKGMPCFEFDAPHMATLKTDFLNRCYPGKEHPSIESTLLPGDRLGQRFEKLGDLDSDKKTIVVAEGFFDYLDTDTVSSTLEQLYNFFGHGTALVSTHFALDELSSFHRWIFRTSVKLVGEELRFDSSMSEFNELLSKNGFHIKERCDSGELGLKLKTHLATDLPMLKGIYLVLAES